MPSPLEILHGSLRVLEASVLPSSQVSSWMSNRDAWQAEVLSTTTVGPFANLTARLEQSLSWQATVQAWRPVSEGGKGWRDAWRMYASKASDAEELASMLLALELRVLYSACTEQFKTVRDAWVAALTSIGGNSSDVPFPSSDMTFEASGSKLVLSTAPMGEGASRYAYKGKVTVGTFCGFGTGSCVVLKVIKPSMFNRGVRLCDSDIRAQQVAEQLAGAFNREVKPTCGGATCHLYFRVGKILTSGGAKYNDQGARIIVRGEALLLEAMIHGTYEKFNSNSGYSSKRGSLPDCFSHWTHNHTGGRYLVCDMQGYRGRPGGPKYGTEENYYVCTDPVVLSRTGEFGCTDLGSAGIEQWLSAHECNDLCKGVGLPKYSGARQQSATGPTVYRPR